jgi:hypothetical protein
MHEMNVVHVCEPRQVLAGHCGEVACAHRIVASGAGGPSAAQIAVDALSPHGFRQA